MKRGPTSATARNSADLTMLDKARAAHGAGLADWVEELARHADAYGLRATGDEIDYSAATVSQVISASYPGDLGRVEEMTRGALMAACVSCPVLGEIGRDACLKNQKLRLSTASPSSVRLYYACRDDRKPCPHSRVNGVSHVE